MINTGEFRNLIREIVRDEIGDKSLYKIGEVASIGDKVTVIFSGEPEPSQKQYTYLKSYSPGLGDRVILMKDKGTYVVLGKIGERGGGITFGEHLAEDAQKHITESGENTNGRYVKFDDGTQICWRNHYIGNVEFIAQTANAVYGGHMGTLTFPASFIENPVAICNARSNGYLNSQVSSVTKSNLQIRIWSNYSTNMTGVTRDWVAVGRWK